MHKLKEVYIDDERYISDDLEKRVLWLQQRSEEIVNCSFTDKEAVTKLYQLIGMLTD